MGSFAAAAAPPFAPDDDDDVVNKYTAIANDVDSADRAKVTSCREIA